MSTWVYLEERDEFRDAAIMYTAQVAVPNDLDEQQPEPVSVDVLTTFLYDTALANLLNIDSDTPRVLAVELGRNFTITARAVASPSEEAQRG